MRPLELEVRNFRSFFGDGARFDFRGRRLVGIVGPIGSGKSSILDAIAFALYGRTPTIAAATKSLIHQRADGATVALRFEVESEVWQVVRALRRKGQSQHSLVRLASDTAEAEELERVVLETDVNRRIVELLGLEFDAFSRSVLLAQGRFAEFLKSRPADRDRVLKGVFGHDRIDAMRELAKRREAETAVDVERSAVRIEDLERVQRRLDDNRAALADTEQRIELLRKAEPRLDDFADRTLAAESQRDGAQRRLDALGAHAGKLPDIEASSALLRDARDAETRRAKLAQALDEAQTALAQAEAAFEAAKPTEQIISQATELLAEREAVVGRLEDLAGRAKDLEGRAEAAARAVAKAGDRTHLAGEQVVSRRKAVEAAQAALANAEAALHDARHLDMATTLRRELAPGEACPVCAQVVAEIPATESSEVAAAERTALAASEALGAAQHDLQAGERVVAGDREALAKASAVLEGLEAELAAGQASHLATTDQLSQLENDLSELLGEGDPASLVASQRDELTVLGEAATAARKRVDRARSEHDEAIVAEQNTTRRLADLRLQLTELATRMESDVEIPEDAGELDAIVNQLVAAWDELTKQLEAQLAAAGSELEAVETERATLLDELELAGDFASELAAAVARAELLGNEVDAAQLELDAAADLVAAHDEAVARRDGYAKVAADLTNSGFIRYMLDDERARLAELGSEHFERLSSGRYRFATDGSFDVIDLTSADATRKADSLSGGETFVASLGLALALAEMVARTGGRLDAFFIDEGFGSLDPEHLDLAMEGIESLAAEGESRLVVVVSHVPELMQRIEDLVVLDRESLTGDTRILKA